MTTKPEQKPEPRKSDLSRYFPRSAVKGFFSLVGKQTAEVREVSVNEDDVQHTDKGWVIGVNDAWDLLDYLHRAGHQRFTMYTMSDQVARYANDPFMGRLAASIEDARVDKLTSDWFDKPVWGHHRKQVQEQLSTLSDNLSRLTPETDLDYVNSVLLTETVMQLIGYMAFDLPLPSLPPILQKFVEYFRDDVTKVRENGSPVDAAMLSSRMAEFMGYMRQRSKQDFTLPPPDKDEDESVTGDGQKSDKQTDKNDSQDEPDENESGESGESDDEDSDKPNESGNESGDTEDSDGETSDRSRSSKSESDSDGEIDDGEISDEDEDSDSGVDGENEESESDSASDENDNDEAGEDEDDSDVGAEDDEDSEDSSSDEADGDGSGNADIDSGDAPSSLPSDIPQDVLDQLEKDAKERVLDALRNMRRNLSSVVKFDDAKIAEMKKHPLDLGQVKIQQTSLSGHEYVSFNVDQERVDYSTLRVKFDLEEERDHSQVRRAKTGLLTPDTWRVITGKMDVFNKPPLKKGRLVVMVDCSSSMGCPCDEHNDPGWIQARVQARATGRTFNPAFYSIKSNADGVTSSWLSWQIVGAICQRFDDALVFAYSFHGNLPNSATGKYQPMTTVSPILPGYKPRCVINGEGARILYGGTPDCVALEYLYDRLMGDVSGAFAIVISDGEPTSPHDGGYGQGSENWRHTKELSDKLSDAGLKYASVLVRTDDLGLYRTEYSLRVDNIADLDNVGPMVGEIARNL